MTPSKTIQDILNLLKKHDLTIATCESVTGGMIISHLIDVPGASLCVKGGIVSYTNEIKIKNVGVNKNTIDKFGVVSQHVANEMAVGIDNKMKCDVSLSITGTANPNTKNEAYMCIKIIDKLYSFKLISKDSDRNSIRVDFTSQALSNLFNLLKEMSK